MIHLDDFEAQVKAFDHTNAYSTNQLNHAKKASLSYHYDVPHEFRVLLRIEFCDFAEESLEPRLIGEGGMCKFTRIKEYGVKNEGVDAAQFFKQ